MRILIPDGSYRLLMQVVYCFSKHKSFEVHVLSDEKYAPMRYSRLVENYKVIDYTSVSDWLKIIDNYVSKYKIDLILPICEESTKKLIVHREQLASKELLVPLSSFENFKKATNKVDLAMHLGMSGISHPKTKIVKPNSINEDKFQLDYPVIAKPSESMDGFGIKYLSNETQLQEFYRCLSRPYVLQEYIDGYDIDCSVLCKDGNVIAYTIQRGILFESRKFSPAIGLEFLQQKEILEIVKKMMASLEWNGVAHIDLRYDNNAKNFKVIEINGRFWGSVDASMATGLNFPHLYCMLARQKEIQQIEYAHIKFYNLKGLVALIKKNPLVLLKWSFINKHTALPFAIKDPIPLLVKFIQRTRVLMKKSA